MRYPLRTGNGIREEVKYLFKSWPKDARYAHATRFMRRQEDGWLRRGTALGGWNDFRPFIDDFHFSVKHGTFRFRIGPRKGQIQIFVEDGGPKHLVPFRDAGSSDGEDLFLHDLQHLGNLSDGRRQGGFLRRLINHNPFGGTHNLFVQ